MEELEIIIVSVFGGAWLLLLVVVLVLCCKVSGLRKRVADLESEPRMRVQRLTMNNDDRNHAFHNPAISPDEELSKRGYSMYVADDVESGRGTERQTGGQFVEELSRELESRQQRQMAPPFLLQGIQENICKSRDLHPVSDHDNPASKQNNLSNSAGNNSNPSGNHSSLYSNQGITAGKNTKVNGNHVNSIGNHVNSTGNNVNPLSKQGRHDSPIGNHDGRNYSHQRTRQSDTNPNFIY